MTAEAVTEFEALLEYLRSSRGFDFTGYKRASLMRRVDQRLHTVGVSRYADYMDHLEVHPHEFTQLFNTILINVTSFFRDVPAWEYLREHMIPNLLAHKRDGEAIRVWSAGCATGQEAYSLAILLAEALGAETFRRRVKIYATDVDEEALAEARLASYSKNDLESVPSAWRDAYFEPVGDRTAFRADLRRSVIFGRHDLMQDAPMSRLDLLVCRNVLMYFNAEAQSKILNRFHFALNGSGCLFLGKAEMLLTHGNLFTPVDTRHRIFARAPLLNPRGRLPMVAQVTEGQGANHLTRLVHLSEVAFDSGPVAQVVVDPKGILALFNQPARSLFALAPTDVGRPLQDLEFSYRPAELRSLIERASTGRRSVLLDSVEWSAADLQTRYFSVLVTPLYDDGERPVGVSITFEDITSRQRLQADLNLSLQKLETAYEELQSTNEELDTTNEELQSTNEELETTNEELQSTNEELETMNEELQSTNQELETINVELRERTEEINNANAFLNAILATLRAGVLVVDQELRVLVWNRRAEDMWGLRSDEVQGKSVLSLDIGLPVDELPIQPFLAGKADYLEVHVEVVNRRGRTIQCRVTCTPYLGHNGERLGVVLLMEEERQGAPTDKVQPPGTRAGGDET